MIEIATESLSPLDPAEAAKATTARSLSAAAIHEIIRVEGCHELERSNSALAWSGLAAGLSMGLSMTAAGVLRAHLPDAEWRPLVVNLGYTIGFIVVILGAQQLYTENTIMPVVPLLATRTRQSLTKTTTLWLVVLLANLLGALLFALVAARTNAFEPDVKSAFESLGREAIAPAFLTIFLRAILAGWIIALMVWMLPATGELELVAIVILAWVVGIAGLSHVVVGAVEVFFLAFRGAIGFADALIGFILPAFIGNTIGGVVLVAALNHAQVAGGKKSHSRIVVQ